MSLDIKKYLLPYDRRRYYCRYRVQGSALVVFEKPRLIRSFKPRLIKLGPIVNIGLGGLMVEYISSKDPADLFSQLSVLTPDHGMMLKQIPFQCVSRLEIAALDAHRKIIRQCIKFETLNQHQLFRLDRFIRSYGGDYPEDRRSGQDRRYVGGPDDPFNQGQGWQNDLGRRKGNDRRAHTDPDQVCRDVLKGK